VFGYHVTGSDGRLFPYGIVVGAVGVAGLSLLLAGARRTSRRGLRQSRQETAAVTRDRDDLVDQRETARAYTAGTPGKGTPPSEPGPGSDDTRRGRLFGRRPAPRQATAGSSESLNGQAAPDVPADTPACRPASGGR